VTYRGSVRSPFVSTIVVTANPHVFTGTPHVVVCWVVKHGQPPTSHRPFQTSGGTTRSMCWSGSRRWAG